MSVPLNVQIVTRARALIADPRNWCQGSLGLTADGSMVYSDDPDAIRFCGIGALERAAYAMGLSDEAVVATANRIAAEITGTDDVQAFYDLNDVVGGHAIVLSAFDRYLAEARS